MSKQLPTRLMLFLAAMYAALAVGAAAAQAAPPLRTVPLSTVASTQGGTFDAGPRPFRWAVSANPGVVDGAPRADQILLRGSRRHRCQSLHVTYAAGGLAQSAALLLRRTGRPDVTVQTQSDTPGRLDAALRPGKAWRLAASTPSVSISVFANGSVKCRSTRGLR